MFSWYWGAVVVCLPLFFRIQTGVDIRFGQDMYFLALMYLSIILFGFKRSPIKHFKGVVFALGALSLYSFIRQFNQVNYTLLYQFFCFNGAILLIIQCLSQDIEKKLIINAMAIACIIQSVWFVLNSYGIDLYFIALDLIDPGRFVKFRIGDGMITSYSGHETSIVGSIHNRTISGAVISTTLVCLFRPKWVFLVPLALYGVYLSDSSMIYLSAAGAITTYLFLKFKSKTMLISIFFFLLFFYNFTIAYGSKFFQDSGRFKVWTNTLSWLEGWDIILGKGLGYFAVHYNQHFEAHKTFLQVHNEYIEFYLCFGLIGVLALAFILKPLFIARKSIIIVPCFVAIMIDAFGSFPFHIAATSLLGIFCYSIIATDQGEIHGIFRNLKEK